MGRNPVSRRFRSLGVLAAVFVMSLAVACSGAGETATPSETVKAETTQAEAATAAAQPETGTASATPTTPEAPAPTSAQSPTTTPQPSAVEAPVAGGDYDSTRNMFRLFSGPGHDTDETRQAISLAIANKDKSMVPLLIELLRFVGGIDLPIATNTALSTITGRESENSARAWHGWMEWLAKNADEYSPPDGYVQWKVALMNQIDPRFGEFLAPAENGSRINLSEVAWGGVRPDGIPDLQNAPVVYADEQDYLLPSDRVFGVSINGDHRAYPLRIVNAHEMANDVLGGEPIALAY